MSKCASWCVAAAFAARAAACAGVTSACAPDFAAGGFTAAFVSATDVRACGCTAIAPVREVIIWKAPVRGKGLEAAATTQGARATGFLPEIRAMNRVHQSDMPTSPIADRPKTFGWPRH